MLLYRIHTVAPVTNITVVGTKLADVKCNGDSTGSARFTVGNFASTSSYSYTVNGVAAQQDKQQQVLL
jgi:hypothetical protein